MIESGKLKIIVKTNAKKTQLLGWDKSRKVLKISVAAPAQDNKANLGTPLNCLQGLTQANRFNSWRR